MNNAWELANEICRRVRRLRLDRAGGFDDDDATFPLVGMSEEDKQPWLDTARVVIEMRDGRQSVDVLRDLCDDWDRYTTTLLSSPAWRNEMRRAIAIEMRHHVDLLWEQCQGKEEQ